MLKTPIHTKKKTILLVSGLATVLYAILSISQLFGETHFYSPLEHIIFILYGLSSYFSCSWATQYIISDKEQLSSSSIFQIIFSSGFLNAIITTGIFLLSRWAYFTYLNETVTYPSTVGIVANISYTFFVIHLIVTSLFLSFFSLQVSHDSSLKQLAAEKENSIAQLKLLQQQITPHFLFNNLNVLASLIPLDPKLAEQFVTKFSNLYRFILKHKDEELISLEDELGFICQYCEVMNIRFENAYKLEIEHSILARDDIMVAPGSLQTCVENAIKHNIASTTSSLSISVSLCNDIIQIENPLRLKKEVQISTKTGLENLTKRYKTLSDHEVNIFKSNDVFRVSIPALFLI